MILDSSNSEIKINHDTYLTWQLAAPRVNMTRDSRSGHMNHRENALSPGLGRLTGRGCTFYFSIGRAAKYI